MYSVSLIPKILAPTRLTCHTKTLIDNIFTNVQDENYLFGNLTCSISDHLLQFVIYPQIKIKSHNINKSAYTRKFSLSDKKKFEEELKVIDWNTILAIDQNDINLSLENFMNIIECLLNKYAPLKKMTKKQLKNLKKPWLTSGILKSVKNKNKIFNKFCKAKDPLRKRGLHQLYKLYRNQITTLTRICKEKHYKQYFETNKQNAMKLQKGIKEIINIKKEDKSQPTTLRSNNSIIDDELVVANIFNSYFGSIAKEIDKKIPKPSNSYKNYLKNQNMHNLFLNAIEEKEIINIISSFDSKKATGPNSIPTDVKKF